MFIKVVNQENDSEVYIKADEIVVVGKVQKMNPIFLGSFIGLKNGQSFIAKEKHEQVRKQVENALKA